MGMDSIGMLGGRSTAPIYQASGPSNRDKADSLANQSLGTPNIDRISFSPEALALAAEYSRSLAAASGRNAASGTGTGQLTSIQSAQADGGMGIPAPDPGACLFSVGGEIVDIGERLMQMGVEDFSKFRNVLEKLQSGDTGNFLGALEEITGKPAHEIRAAIADMDDEELNAFAASLAKVTGGSPGTYLRALREIHHSVEKQAE